MCHASPCQGRIVLNLHQYLINWGGQQGEAGKPSSRGFGAPILLSIFDPSHLLSSILLCILLSLPLLGLLFSGQQCVFRVHVLSSSVKYIRHGFWVVFV